MPILITCETAGTLIPDFATATGFELRGDATEGDHYGGELAERMANLLGVESIVNRYRGDLVDVSRSVGHRGLFGPVTRGWTSDQKRLLVESVYHPYRDRVHSSLQRLLQQYTYVIHLSVRTFDLRRGGKLRRTDVGLLYDPSREHESDLCVDWVNEAYNANPNLRVRRNYPRRGTVDCITRAMRQRFSTQPYLGIEVWMNRAWAARDVRLRDEAVERFSFALQEIVGTASREAA